VGVKVGVANFFLGQSIGIDENNTFLYPLLVELKGVLDSSVRMNAILGLGMQIPAIPAQRKFVSATCHAHKPPKLWFLQF